METALHLVVHGIHGNASSFFGKVSILIHLWQLAKGGQENCACANLGDGLMNY